MWWVQQSPRLGDFAGVQVFKAVIEVVSLETFGFPRQREKHHRTEGTMSLLLSQKARAGYRGGHTQRHAGINLTYNTATANLLSLTESYF